jgi:hypothetical protein
MGAVDIHPMAVGNSLQYRPHDKPVSKRLRGDTVDAGGISRGSSGKIRVVAFSAVQSHRRGVLKAASNAFLAAERPSMTRRTQLYKKSPRNGLYAHRGQADRASSSRPGCELLLPLPSYQRPEGVQRIGPSAPLCRCKYIVVRSGPRSGPWVFEAADSVAVPAPLCTVLHMES